jgi:hypothetical protein
MCTEVWCHSCSVSSVSGTCGATTALYLPYNVPAVPQLLCTFRIRYLWCNNCCLFCLRYLWCHDCCLFCLRYLWCHDCSVPSISGTCFCYLRLLYISHVSSCHLSVRSCTPHARRCPRRCLLPLTIDISPLRQNHTPTAVECNPALVTNTMAT